MTRALGESAPYAAFVSWLRGVCARFDEPVDALELGCGTGRYFWALERVRTLIGIDASPAMLARARHPFREDAITVGHVTLIHGDLLEHEFGTGQFDLVYSIGVLAEHVPLQSDAGVSGRALAQAGRSIRVFDRASRIALRPSDAWSGAWGRWPNRSCLARSSARCAGGC